jgi:hypothetical protein
VLQIPSFGLLSLSSAVVVTKRMVTDWARPAGPGLPKAAINIHNTDPRRHASGMVRITISPSSQALAS